MRQSVVGWYVTRPGAGCNGAPRPTLRELAVLQSLREQLQPPVVCPPVLLVVSVGAGGGGGGQQLVQRETQVWSYGLYYLGPETAALGWGADAGGEGCVN